MRIVRVRTWTRTCLLVAMTVWAGCGRLAPASRELAPIPLPESGADPQPFEEAVTRRLAGVATFRASGVLQFEHAGHPVRQVNFLLLAGEEAQMRLRGTRAIGPVLFEIIATTTEFVFTIPTRRRAYEGARGAEESETDLLVPSAITDPLRISLHPEGVHFLTHEADGTALVEVLEDRAAGLWRIAQRMSFDPATGRIRDCVSYDNSGAPALVTHFADYRDLAGLGADDAFPFRVEIERHSANMVITLLFRTVEPNVALPDQAFDVAPPKGYSVRPASEFDAKQFAEEAAADAPE